METSGCGECALIVVWDELLSMSGDDNGVVITAMGALCLVSRTLAGLCWDEKWATEEDWTGTDEMTALFVRAEYMREAYQVCLAWAEGALMSWGWWEIEHEVWAARFAEASMYQDTWSPPSGWSDDD